MTRFLALLTLVWSAYAQDGWILAEVTAYCPCALCCDVRTERTANGTNTNKEPYGVAASRDIPLGSTVFIPVGAGYLDSLYSHDSQRIFNADDRGAALDSERRRYGHTRLDLRYKSHEAAVRFGRRLIMVYISAKPQEAQQ